MGREVWEGHNEEGHPKGPNAQTPNASRGARQQAKRLFWVCEVRCSLPAVCGRRTAVSAAHCSKPVADKRHRGVTAPPKHTHTRMDRTLGGRHTGGGRNGLCGGLSSSGDGIWGSQCV